ncbi:hypothetical protein MRB56_13385 [Halomonas cupida]|nr:hypothetical protein [Halomonas cupida]
MSAVLRAVQLGAGISIDGGFQQNCCVAQFPDSASGRGIRVPCMQELTALGLAGLCGVDIESAEEAGEAFVPAGEVSDDDHQHFARALDCASGWQDSWL